MRRWMWMGWVALVQAALAWQPANWVYVDWPWAMESDSGQWYYLHPRQDQWAHGFGALEGWRQLRDSGLAQGWSWHVWPYAFSQHDGAWHYLNETDRLACLRMSDRQWAFLGMAEDRSGMAYIPGGAFYRGDATGETYDYANEYPVRSITTEPYLLGKTHVPLGLWNQVRTWGLAHGYGDIAPGLGRASNHPVTFMSWYDIVKWCNAYSEMEGLTPCYTVEGQVYRTGIHDPVCHWDATGYRLPTEAEWEKAARGGLARKRFPWGDRISHAQANYSVDCDGNGNPWNDYDDGPECGPHPDFIPTTPPYLYTNPVDHFPPNGYGVHDMAGNVWDWCWDWYQADYYTHSPAHDPRGPETGEQRIHRGGDWINATANWCRSAFRSHGIPAGTSGLIGFRVARKP
jgi:formylglycine-generating enzyme